MTQVPTTPQAQAQAQLYHVSSQAYAKGSIIGGYNPTYFWVKHSSSEPQKSVEEVTEQARPAQAPCRRTAVFATSDIWLVHRFARNIENARIFRVQIAVGATSWGPVDMTIWVGRRWGVRSHPR